jgi:hypothetical protein
MKYLVFMQTLQNQIKHIKKCKMRSTDLDLHIEHGIRSDSKSKSGLDIPSKTLFVALLNCRPFLTELLLLCETQETFKFCKVLEPNALLNFQGLGDETTKFHVALIQPATRGDYGNSQISVLFFEVEIACVPPLVTFPNLSIDQNEIGRKKPATYLLIPSNSTKSLRMVVLTSSE